MIRIESTSIIGSFNALEIENYLQFLSIERGDFWIDN